MAGTINHIPTNGDSRGKGRTQNEPLQRFAEAKEFMGQIYTDLENHVNELAKFYNAIEEEQQKFVPAAKISEVKRFRTSILAIKEMFGRDKMKVVFFGRTSNGKSSVINAMLHSRVLPQGMGHTTCCFLQVEGSPGTENYCVFEDNGEKIPISELDNAGHALSSENINLSSMGKDSLIKVYYPKSFSKLMQNEVVIVDSPGIDVNKEFDSWIDKHCLDADVFVLVCNSESTLTRAEKDFFHRVKDKISKPNIFILNNRWENSNSESEARRQLLRNQHESCFVEFLCKDMQVCPNESVAKDHFFFISAREVLDSRLKSKGEITNPYQMEGFQRRLLEFQNFEAHFEKSISKSAIRTKFEGHSNRAREIIDDMRHNLETVYNLATREIQRLKLDLGLRNSKLLSCQEHFRNFELKYMVELKQLRSEVHSSVYSDFHEEIARLESIFDRFKYEFGDTSQHIENYKTALANYVNNVVSTDLQNLCTGALTGKIWRLEESMFSRVREIVGEEYINELENFIRHRHQPFMFVINVNCVSLLRDFHEDLEFRFSLGIESMARRVLSMTRGQPITAIGRDVVRMPGGNAYQTDKNDVDTFIARVFVQSATYLANGSVGIALAGLIVYKNVDWRWIAGGAGLLGAMYAFERYKWNTGAKEERLKDQFRSHLEQRLQLVEQMHTAQCEAQVVNELNTMFGGLKSTTANIHKNMKEKIEKTQKAMNQMDGFLKGLSTLKGKTNFVNSSLEAFAAKFLVPDFP